MRDLEMGQKKRGRKEEEEGVECTDYGALEVVLGGRVVVGRATGLSLGAGTQWADLRPVASRQIGADAPYLGIARPAIISTHQRPGPFSEHLRGLQYGGHQN